MLTNNCSTMKNEREKRSFADERGELLCQWISCTFLLNNRFSCLSELSS